MSADGPTHWGPCVGALLALDGGAALLDALAAALAAPPGPVAVAGGPCAELEAALAVRGYAIEAADSRLVSSAVAPEGGIRFHDLLQSARARLAPGGVLAVIGVFARRHDGHASEPVPRLEYWVRAAGRYGLRDGGYRDLSDAARAALVDPAAGEACAHLADGLADGRYTCGVQRFEAASEPPCWSVYEVGAQDFEDLATLFRRVFGNELAAETWRWKYGGGRGQGIMARRGGAAVAHYGGVSRPIRYFGQPQLAVQICDVMVDRDERGVLTRRGPFFLCAATFLERYIGYGLKHLLGYGFPTHRAMRAAERQGLYGAVGEMCEAQWTPRARRPRGGSIRALEPARDAGAVDRLWARMMAGLGDAIIGERTWAYVEHRYLRHPDKRYELVLVCGRLSRRPQALLVLRADEGRCELLDVVGAPRHFPVAMKWACFLAHERGARDLFCWVSRGYAARFESMGAQCAPLDVCNPTSVWTHGPEPERLRDRWWFTSGDTDFR
jgi:hypothetical protein